VRCVFTQYAPPAAAGRSGAGLYERGRVAARTPGHGGLQAAGRRRPCTGHPDSQPAIRAGPDPRRSTIGPAIQPPATGRARLRPPGPIHQAGRAQVHEACRRTRTIAAPEPCQGRHAAAGGRGADSRTGDAAPRQRRRWRVPPDPAAPQWQPVPDAAGPGCPGRRPGQQELWRTGPGSRTARPVPRSGGRSGIHRCSLRKHRPSRAGGGRRRAQVQPESWPGRCPARSSPLAHLSFLDSGGRSVRRMGYAPRHVIWPGYPSAGARVRRARPASPPPTIHDPIDRNEPLGIEVRGLTWAQDRRRAARGPDCGPARAAFRRA